MPPALMLLLLAAPACAGAPQGPAVVIGDSHMAGDFGRGLYQGLKDDYDVGVYAVCDANAGWWLGDEAARKKVPARCHLLHAGPGEPAGAVNGKPSDPPTAADLLKKSPALVVIALGSNLDATIPGTMRAAARLIALVPWSSRCVWIGPPEMPSLRATVASFYAAFPHMLRDAKLPCELVDARPLLDPKLSRSDHWFGAGAVAAGRRAAAAIR